MTGEMWSMVKDKADKDRQRGKTIYMKESSSKASSYNYGCEYAVRSTPSADTNPQYLGTLDNVNIPWKRLVLGSLAGDYVFTSYLRYRQHKVYQRTEVPANLRAIVTEEVFLESNELSRHTSKYNFVKKTTQLIVDLAIIQYDLVPQLYHASKATLTNFALSAADRALIRPTSIFAVRLSSLAQWLATSKPIQSAVAATVLGVFSGLFFLPFDYYFVFVVEKKTNKMSIKTFFLDQLKMKVLLAVANFTFVAVVEKIFDMAGLGFVPYFTVACVAVQILATFLVPLIAPLFNKYSKFEEGELKTKIDALCNGYKFPLSELSVEHMSEKTAHSNAYFIGLPWKKQIVVGDTLIEKCTEGEILAILCHELGHWKLKHTLQALLSGNFFLLLRSLSFLAFVKNKGFYVSLGYYPGEQPAMLLFCTGFNDLTTPLTCANVFGATWLSQKNEYEADAFAKAEGKGDDLATGLVAIHNDNLGVYESDWLFSSYTHSHPLLSDRLDALGYRPKTT